MVTEEVATELGEHHNQSTTVRTLLTEWGARQRLEEAGIAGPPCIIATTAEAAVAASQQIGFPVVLKLYSESISHKTEAKGVHLDLRTPQDVQVAFAAITLEAARLHPHGEVKGVLVQPFVRDGIDIYLGAARDDSFGPYLMVGLGGIWVELLEDIAAIVLPATEAEILNAFDQLRGAPLLRGLRGQPACDRQALASLALALGRFVTENADVAEVDLNPVRVMPADGGVHLLDARMLLQSPGLPAPERMRPHKSDLAALLDPQSVVVIGASLDAAKLGSRMLQSIVRHGFKRPVWAVHPREREVQGVPAFPSLAELPGRADLALITVKGEQVPELVRECGQNGIRTAVVCTAGFGESGAEGQELQAALVSAAREFGTCIVGPNTGGLMNSAASLYASFLGVMAMEPIPGGNVSLITQSGSVGSSLLGRGWDRGIGFRSWVATGDEAGLQMEDLVEHLATDPGTRVIALFLESIRDGVLLRSALQRARVNGKFVVAYAIGRSETGRQAVQSHTGALAGNHRIYDALFRQEGVNQVTNLDEMLDVIQALSWCRIPAGPRVAIVSSSGAACGIAADDCEANGLTLTPLPGLCREEVARVLPSFASISNPLDLTAEVLSRPELAAPVLESLVKSGAYDALLISLGTNQGAAGVNVAKAVVEQSRKSSIPFVVSRLGPDSMGAEVLAHFRENRIPVFSTPTRAARALRHLMQQAK